MTNREFYTAVIASVDNDELKAFATEAIEKLDARNAKRASTPSKTQKENAPLIEKIASLLTSTRKRTRKGNGNFHTEGFCTRQEG